MQKKKTPKKTKQKNNQSSSKGIHQESFYTLEQKDGDVLTESVKNTMKPTIINGQQHNKAKEKTLNFIHFSGGNLGK